METSYQEENLFSYQQQKQETLAEQLGRLPVVCGCCGEVFTAASFRRHYRSCPQKVRKKVNKKA